MAAAALTGGAGGSVGSIASDMLGLKSTSEIFVGILSSRTVQDKLVQQFDLRKLYGVGRIEDARQGRRSVYFAGRWLDTPVFGRDRLPVGATIQGPAIVAQLDTTILIDPGATATIDRLGNIVIAVGAEPA